MMHTLKTDPDCFAASWAGRKPFEIRLNDRNYNDADTLWLNETRWTGESMKAGKPLEYTGRTIKQEVLYVLRGPRFGLAEGWCVMGVKELERGEDAF